MTKHEQIDYLYFNIGIPLHIHLYEQVNVHIFYGTGEIFGSSYFTNFSPKDTVFLEIVNA